MGKKKHSFVIPHLEGHLGFTKSSVFRGVLLCYPIIYIFLLHPANLIPYHIISHQAIMFHFACLCLFSTFIATLFDSQEFVELNSKLCFFFVILINPLFVGAEKYHFF